MKRNLTRPWRSAALIALAGAVGCGLADGVTGRIDIFTCEDPCGNGQPGTSCEHPCGDCRGECVALAPLGFDGPALVWVGRELEAPPCPFQAPTPVYDGHADLDDKNRCPTCTCAEPACLLPATVIASSETCAGAGGTSTLLGPPPYWGGYCTPTPVVPASELGSLTFAPLGAYACEPIVAPVPRREDLYSPWGTFARACMGQVPDGRCDDPALVCQPTVDPPPSGFRHCVMWTLPEEAACPPAYPDELTFFGGLEDTRGCLPCECTQTEAPICSASVSLHYDALCSMPLTTTLITTNPICQDAPQGLEVGTMSAEWITRVPGKCEASGGLPFGEAKPLNPRTFCCQPPD